MATELGFNSCLRSTPANHPPHIWLKQRTFGLLTTASLARAEERAFAGPGGGVEQLPFENDMSDAVFDFGMLHHVPVWQQGITEIRRVLKPGGRFFFEEVTRKALESWL